MKELNLIQMNILRAELFSLSTDIEWHTWLLTVEQLVRTYVKLNWTTDFIHIFWLTFHVNLDHRTDFVLKMLTTDYIGKYPEVTLKSEESKIIFQGEWNSSWFWFAALPGQPHCCRNPWPLQWHSRARRGRNRWLCSSSPPSSRCESFVRRECIPESAAC